MTPTLTREEAMANPSVAARLGHAPAPKKRNKYNNTPTIVDEVRFDSKHEARRYLALKVLQSGGEVLWFALHPKFVLPGGVLYISDFVVVWKDGSTTVEDAKSSATSRNKTYRLKKRQTEALYRVKIEEV